MELTNASIAHWKEFFGTDYIYIFNLEGGWCNFKKKMAIMKPNNYIETQHFSPSKRSYYTKKESLGH